MKKVLLSILLCVVCCVAFSQTENKLGDTIYLKPIEVLSIRANDLAPFAKTNLSKKDIEQKNLGQDLPILLNETPSTIVTSDAGNGVGYTGIRIRGTDATRINVTLNGIPYNDAESQGTYFVDLPDIASSVSSIQVQRGVGTSSNGSGAFGATINLATNDINEKFYAELNNSFGSFNTWKNNLRFGSGIINKQFTIDARLSRISSDGYVDRAFSNLKSFYVSAAWLNKKSSLRFNIFSGQEKTYQAWYGVNKATLDTNRTYNAAGQEQPKKPYANQTDNYLQTHYQLFFNHQFSEGWKINAALFLTKGAGYYEEYRASQKLNNYNLPDYYEGTTIIPSMDLIRQLWLDNNFYGSIFSIQHQKNKTQWNIGGGWNRYDGKHFGEIIWAEKQAAVPLNFRWYNLSAQKTDFSLYTKWAEQWNPHWQSFADIQLRLVKYEINGFRNTPNLQVINNFNFINPKIGLTYSNKKWQGYISYAMANKEPNRDDFEAGAAVQPLAETLHDFELGLDKKTAQYSFGANIYYMLYKNQLVLTGKINDVGAYTRTNIASSFRIGIELQGKAIFTKWLQASANISFSENKVIDFSEFIDDYDNGGQKINQYKKTDISFSPSVVGSSNISIIPFKNAAINFISKYVSRQFLDNTSQQNRSIEGYFVQDVRLNYLLGKKIFKATNFILQLNNIFNKKYVSNGYTFSYIAGGLNTENYYFPMATFNFMLGVNVSL